MLYDKQETDDRNSADDSQQGHSSRRNQVETTTQPDSQDFEDEMEVKSWTASYMDAAKASTPTILTMIFFQMV